jgi:hypothetical protein
MPRRLWLHCIGGILVAHGGRIPGGGGVWILWAVEAGSWWRRWCYPSSGGGLGGDDEGPECTPMLPC